MAYLKRDTRYELGHSGGLLAGVSPKHFQIDTLSLCVARRDGGDERCTTHWDLPLIKQSDLVVGEVSGDLGWNEGQLVYRICLSGFRLDDPSRETCRDQGGKPGFEITNLPADGAVPPTPSAAPWRVHLDQNPYAASSPI